MDVGGWGRGGDFDHISTQRFKFHSLLNGKTFEHVALLDGAQTEEASASCQRQNISRNIIHGVSSGDVQRMVFKCGAEQQLLLKSNLGKTLDWQRVSADLNLCRFFLLLLLLLYPVGPEITMH